VFSIPVVVEPGVVEPGVVEPGVVEPGVEERGEVVGEAVAGVVVEVVAEVEELGVLLGGDGVGFPVIRIVVVPAK
jgi:hypothetical protein